MPIREPMQDAVTASPVTIPPPLAGINESDDLPQHKPSDAIRLVNFVPRDDGLKVRGGSLRTATVPSAVVSLMCWAGRVPIAATATGLYDVRAREATIVTGLQSGTWTGDTITNAGGPWLVMANGYDAPRAFDGSTWVVPTITGLPAATQLAGATVHQRRVWFYRRGTTDLYYLAPGAISGPAYCMPIGPMLSRGGTVVGLMSRRGDTGVGADDQLVAVTSQGQMIVFAGTDPDNAATWGQPSVHEIDVPVGWRPLARIGGEVVVMTRTGLYTVQAIAKAAKERVQAEALTDRAFDTWNSHEHEWGSSDWQCLDTGIETGLVVVNRPGGGQLAAHKGRWTTFADLAATAWVDTVDGPLFGTAGGAIRRYGAAANDEGQPIGAELVTSYQRFARNKLMRALRVRPLMASVPVVPRFHVLADYERPADSYRATTAASGAAAFGSAWGTKFPAELRRWGWYGVAGRGTAMALVMSVRTTAPLTYSGAELLVSAGGNL